MNDNSQDSQEGSCSQTSDELEMDKTPVATRVGIKYLVENSRGVGTDELVRRICGYLERCGVTVWYD